MARGPWVAPAEGVLLWSHWPRSSSAAWGATPAAVRVRAAGGGSAWGPPHVLGGPFPVGGASASPGPEVASLSSCRLALPRARLPGRLRRVLSLGWPRCGFSSRPVSHVACGPDSSRSWGCGLRPLDQGRVGWRGDGAGGGILHSEVPLKSLRPASCVDHDCSPEDASKRHEYLVLPPPRLAPSFSSLVAPGFLFDSGSRRRRPARSVSVRQWFREWPVGDGSQRRPCAPRCVRVVFRHRLPFCRRVPQAPRRPSSGSAGDQGS